VRNIFFDGEFQLKNLAAAVFLKAVKDSRRKDADNDNITALFHEPSLWSDILGVPLPMPETDEYYEKIRIIRR